MVDNETSLTWHLFSASQSQMQTSHVPAYLHFSNNEKNVARLACATTYDAQKELCTFDVLNSQKGEQWNNKASKSYFLFFLFALMNERVKRLTFSIVKVCCGGALLFLVCCSGTLKIFYCQKCKIFFGINIHSAQSHMRLQRRSLLHLIACPILHRAIPMA